MAIRLSNRLSALASLVSKGHRLADIGTDHGYIPIYLCQTGIIPSAIAMDIGKGPLQQATAHIKQQGLSSRIRTRLSDGLTALQPGEADTILIAGMGGGLVMKILSQGTHALTGSEELILQPQSEIQREETVQVQVEDAFGPVLLQKKHPVLKEWLQRELKTVDTVCRQLAAQPENERITIRMAQVQEKRQLILEALKRYETADV